jgi:alcohol-forming fatty acyl-CoA reductase
MSSQVVRFYEGRCVLVTGGTGFMGRVLIEKLLRSCHDISKIYLLLRTKAGGVVQDRIKDINDIPV